MPFLIKKGAAFFNKKYTMYDNSKVKECLRGLIGWREHYDLTEVPPLSEEMKESQTGEYYQDIHPALRLDLISATIPQNRDLEEFLAETEEASIGEILNDITEKRQLDRTAKEIVANDIIYNSEGWVNDVIINESRFVGVRFRLDLELGLKATVNRLALQFTQPQTGLTLYLYHSNRAKVLKKIEYNSTEGGSFNWMEVLLDLHAYNEDLSGGSFYLGYYQNDITGQAIQYKKLNWESGYCGTCGGGVNQAKYKSVSKYITMQPFYVPNPSLSIDKDFMFEPNSIIEVYENNWGFNFNISVSCDLTRFWCDNRTALRGVLGLKVAIKILRMMQFSQQINYIEEQLKSMIIRDLEGDKETNYINLFQKYGRALKSVNFNTSSISKTCLPCDRNSGVSYGMV